MHIAPKRRQRKKASVDRQTVEKVLSAVLGLSFNTPESEVGRGRDRDEKSNVGSADSRGSSKIGKEEHPWLAES